MHNAIIDPGGKLSAGASETCWELTTGNLVSLFIKEPWKQPKRKPKVPTALKMWQRPGVLSK